MEMYNKIVKLLLKRGYKRDYSEDVFYTFYKKSSFHSIASWAIFSNPYEVLRILKDRLELENNAEF